MTVKSMPIERLVVSMIIGLAFVFPPILCRADDLVYGGGRKFREISFSKPKIIKRSNKAWIGRGRIIGRVENAASDYKLVIYRVNGAGKPWDERIHSKEVSVYESKWLAPGEYRVIVKANGFKKWITPLKVKVEGGADTKLDVTFGTQEFKLPH